MIKTLKWIYKLGQQNERRRIRLLIKEHLDNKPELLDRFGNGENVQINYERRLDLWNAVHLEMCKLTYPKYEVTERQVTELDDEL